MTVDPIALARSGMPVDAAEDPLQRLSGGMCGGGILVKDSLDAPAAFLLPWLVRACVQDGFKVGGRSKLLHGAAKGCNQEHKAGHL